MTFLIKHRLFILLSLVLAIIAGIFIQFSYTQAKQSLYAEQQQLAHNYFSAFDIAYRSTQSHVNSIRLADINIPISDKFSFIFKSLTSEFAIDAAVLLDENYNHKNIWSTAVQQSLSNTSAINGLIIEETTSDQIKQLIAAKPEHQISPTDSAIDVEIRSFDNHLYLYSSKSLRNYLDDVLVNEADVGQIVIWQDVTGLYDLLDKQLETALYWAGIGFLLVELFVIFLLRRLSYRLNHVIGQQSIELDSRNEVLEQLVQGKSLATILESIVLAIEQIDTQAVCSILLLDNEGKHLLHGAAPNLPDFYNEAINGVEIGYGMGSCGTATFTRTRVIVDDIQSHPYWANYTELAKKADLGACWSEPIIGTNNKVLGSFAIYHHQPMTSPSEGALKLIESAAQLAAVVIEHKNAHDERLLLSRVFSAAREGIMVTDSLGKIIAVNPMFSEITGYNHDEVIGKKPSILSSGQHNAEFYADMWQSVTTLGHWQGEIWNRKKNGQRYAEQLTISSLLDEAGSPHQYVGLFSDITSSKEQQQTLELMAHYDVLTKLPNRALFADRLERSIARSKRNKTLLAICFLDLDDFKPVNDNYGHGVGDQLLIEVANRLTLALRDEDTVSRQGGDEFAILLSNVSSIEQCKALLNRIHRSLAKPYLIDGEMHYVSASSGATIYPLDDANIDTLMRHADQAMYQAKLAGKNSYRLFNVDDEQKVITQHTQLQEIKLALENNEFCLYYQPKVKMKTGEVFGAEALIRWLHPERGLILPASFLPILAGTSLGNELGDWVINTALSQAEIWQKQDIELEISVNISSAHLQSASFITQLNEALLRHPTVKAKNLQLEILESNGLDDIETIRSIIQTCRELLDVNIALDNFGTGYSSLTHLRVLHTNVIKIDQHFIRDMLDDPSDYAIIEGIISLAESFNRTVIAEGVEMSDHGITLLLMGCDAAQGYEISYPLPADIFPNWLKNYQPNMDWISHGALKLTPKETKIKLMILSIQHWYEAFKIKQSASPTRNVKWPLMNPKLCQHGTWLKRARDEQLFDDEWLTELEQAHENMHIIATNIMIKHLDENTIVTSDDLSKLHQAVESMMIILKTNGEVLYTQEAL